jgi:predicted nucleic acid-binding protein
MQTVELDYAALTLDSNVFHNLNLEHGLLAQLQQFSSSPVKLVISEVVLQEVRKHLVEETRSARAKLRSALKTVKSPFGISKQAAKEFEADLLGELTDVEIVEMRLGRFLSETNAFVVTATGMDVERLLSLYFETAPPFEGSGDKKAEFPDAIALLSLEQWAKKHGTKLLAVSKDVGWLNFAKTSDYIDVIENLADALSHFQPHNAAKNIIEALQGQIESHSGSDILETLKEFIIETTNESDVDVQYSSAISAELDETEVHYMSHDFVLSKNGQPIVDLIRIEASWLVMRLRVNIAYEVHANFSMAVWDSTDREYVSIGSSSAVAEDSYECDVLLSLTGDFSKGIELTEVGEFDFDLKLPGVDVGEVEPNMHDD